MVWLPPVKHFVKQLMVSIKKKLSGEGAPPARAARRRWARCAPGWSLLTSARALLVACATATTLLFTLTASPLPSLPLPLRSRALCCARESRQVEVSVSAALAQVWTMLRDQAKRGCRRGPSAPSPPRTAVAGSPRRVPDPRSPSSPRRCCRRRGCRRSSCARGRRPPPAPLAPAAAQGTSVVSHTRGYSVDQHDRCTKFSATLGATAVVEEESVVVATTALMRRTRRAASVEESGGGGGVTGW